MKNMIVCQQWTTVYIALNVSKPLTGLVILTDTSVWHGPIEEQQGAIQCQ